MRRVQCALQRACRAVVRHAALVGSRSRNHHHRRDRGRLAAAPGAAGVYRRASDSVWLLYRWNHYRGGGAARAREGSDRCADCRCTRSEPLPLRHPRADPQGDPLRGTRDARSDQSMTGVLPQSLKTTPRLDRWVRFNADRTVTVFSGKVELGQGIETAIVQMAADELDVALERLSLVAGDTRQSPDEWYTAGSQSIEVGGMAIRL